MAVYHRHRAALYIDKVCAVVAGVPFFVGRNVEHFKRIFRHDHVVVGMALVVVRIALVDGVELLLPTAVFVFSHYWQSFLDAHDVGVFRQDVRQGSVAPVRFVALLVREVDHVVGEHCERTRFGVVGHFMGAEVQWAYVENRT